MMSCRRRLLQSQGNEEKFLKRGKRMFYQYIDTKTCPTAAPYPLIINGKNVFTNDKKLYNNHGYYEIVSTPYPQDGKEYSPLYNLKNNSIVQEWGRIEK